MHWLRTILGFAPTRPLLALLITVFIQILFAVIAGLFDGATLVSKFLSCGIAVLVLLGLGKLERQSLEKLGLHPRFGAYGLGFVVGCFLICLITVSLVLAGGYSVLEVTLSPEFMGWAATLFFAAFAEEVLFRGILFRMSEEGWGTGPALLFSAVIFGLIHFFNPGATILSSLAIGLGGGLMLGSVYVLTRNLWAVSGLHFGWNLAQSVFGFRVSGVSHPEVFQSQITGSELWTGGVFGPEAGLIALIVTLCFSILTLYLATRAKQVHGRF